MHVFSVTVKLQQAMRPRGLPAPLLYRNKKAELPRLQSCLSGKWHNQGGAPINQPTGSRPADGCQLNEGTTRTIFLLKVFINDLGVSVGVTQCCSQLQQGAAPTITTKIY